MSGLATLHLTDLQAGRTAAEVSPIVNGRLVELAGMLSGNAPEVIKRYAMWLENTERAIGNVLHRPTVMAWCHDEMYWRITERATPGHDQAMTFDLLRYDIERRHALLTVLQEEADRATKRWDDRGDIVLLDTSMIRAVLGKPEANLSLTGVPWNETTNSQNAVRLVLPLAVLSELDRTKRPSSKAPAEAQAVIRWIDANIDSVDEPKALRTGSVLTSTYHLSIEFYIEPFEASTDDTDLSVIQTSAALQQLTKSRVVLGTRDTSMRWRAAAAGVNAFKFPFGPEDR